MKLPTPEEAERLQQAILAREVEEELQKERLLNFWKKYKTILIGSVIGIILLTAGTEVYRSWHQKVRLNESDEFEKAILLNHKGEEVEALRQLEQLSINARTGYKHLAQMRIAGIYLNSNQKEKGLQALKKLIDNSQTPTGLKSIAILSYVGNQIGTADAPILEKELAPLLAQKNAYYASAVELQAVLLLSQNKQPDAVRLVKEALTQPNLNQDMQKRLNELLSVIEKQEIK